MPVTFGWLGLRYTLRIWVWTVTAFYTFGWLPFVLRCHATAHVVNILPHYTLTLPDSPRLLLFPFGLCPVAVLFARVAVPIYATFISHYRCCGSGAFEFTGLHTPRCLHTRCPDCQHGLRTALFDCLVILYGYTRYPLIVTRLTLPHYRLHAFTPLLHSVIWFYDSPNPVCRLRLLPPHSHARLRSRTCHVYLLVYAAAHVCLPTVYCRLRLRFNLHTRRLVYRLRIPHWHLFRSWVLIPFAVNSCARLQPRYIYGYRVTLQYAFILWFHSLITLRSAFGLPAFTLRTF